MTKLRFFFTIHFMKKPKRLDFTEDEVDALITWLESGELNADDFPLMADVLRAICFSPSKEAR